MTWVEKMTVVPAAASSRIRLSSRPWLIASSPEKFLERPGPGELQTIYSAVAQDIAHGTSSLIN